MAFGGEYEVLEAAVDVVQPMFVLMLFLVVVFGGGIGGVCVLGVYVVGGYGQVHAQLVDSLMFRNCGNVNLDFLENGSWFMMLHR